ncbi:MAG: helix-turn-helix transcriptional regulator, partial [Lachnospiraceae bacterium]|nr:helix-turn-helix transcriptional regulator [Lachnospiraceae bacterium]
IDYGYVQLNLDKIMKEQGISINKLAFRAEMQRTQLKAYIKNDLQRIDLSILARLCYALECDLNDLIEYVPPQNPQTQK